MDNGNFTKSLDGKSLSYKDILDVAVSSLEPHLKCYGSKDGEGSSACHIWHRRTAPDQWKSSNPEHWLWDSVIYIYIYII